MEHWTTGKMNIMSIVIAFLNLALKLKSVIFT